MTGDYLPDAAGHLWTDDRGQGSKCTRCGLYFARWSGDECPHAEIGSTMTDDEADRILAALGREGFVLPYAVHSRDYLPDDPRLEGDARRDAIRRLKAADAEVERQNRDALRRALEGVEQR